MNAAKAVNTAKSNVATSFIHFAPSSQHVAPLEDYDVDISYSHLKIPKEPDATALIAHCIHKLVRPMLAHPCA